MKHIRKVIMIVFCFLIVLEVQAQSWSWANNAASTWFDYPVITSDQNGNIIQAVNFYGGTCAFSGYTSNPKAGGNDMLLIKYNGAGVVQWWKQYGWMNTVDDELITAMVCDSSGNTYITGTFCTDSLSFGNAYLKKQMWYGGYYVPYANFLVKIDAAGNTVWAKMIGESGDNFYSSSMTMDIDGNLYMGGFASANIYMNGDTIGYGTFLSKYDSNGNKIWMRKIADVYFPDLDYEFGICNIINKDDKLYIAGNFRSDTVTIDSLLLIFSSGFKYTSGFCLFDTSGIAIQTYTLNGNKNILSYGRFSSTVVDMHDGFLYLIGSYSDTLYLQTDTLVNNLNYHKLFMLKLEDNFNEVWIKELVSINGISGSFINVNMSNEIFISGTYIETDVIFNNCLSAYVAAPEQGIFILKLDTGGVCQSVIDTKDGEIWNGTLSGNQPVITGIHRNITFGSTSFTWLNGQDAYLAKVDFTTGVGEQEREGIEALLIYSNPNSGSCTIEIPEEFKGSQTLYLQISNSSGKIVFNRIISSESKSIAVDLSSKAKGKYEVQLRGKSKVYRGSILIQ